MSIAIYTLTSALHDEKAINAVTQEFLNSLNIEYDLKGNDYVDYGCHDLDLIYVRTGGTEGIFKELLPALQSKSERPVYLLTSGTSNSLAASMEILSFLRQNNLMGEIIHGSVAYIRRRIIMLEKIAGALRQLCGCRLGIIGEPSDWLISSHAVPEIIKQRLGIELVNIPIQELLDIIAMIPQHEVSMQSPTEAIGNALPGAYQIYEALQVLIGRYQLQGFTIRCFDLLTAVRNTGCLALAKLNSEGYVAGCEGDVPAMLSMKIVQVLTGVSGFQANPASINPETGQMVFAHCTIPFNMVERYELDTHFESGIGVGIRGYMKEGPVTIFKISGNLSRAFVTEGELLSNQSRPNLCRTQQTIQLSEPQKVSYFLTDPIGNHHIILPGHHEELIKEMLKAINRQ